MFIRVSILIVPQWVLVFIGLFVDVGAVVDPVQRLVQVQRRHGSDAVGIADVTLRELWSAQWDGKHAAIDDHEHPIVDVVDCEGAQAAAGFFEDAPDLVRSFRRPTERQWVTRFQIGQVNSKEATRDGILDRPEEEPVEWIDLHVDDFLLDVDYEWTVVFSV